MLTDEVAVVVVVGEVTGVDGQDSVRPGQQVPKLLQFEVQVQTPDNPLGNTNTSASFKKHFPRHKSIVGVVVTGEVVVVSVVVVNVDVRVVSGQKE